MQPKIKNKLNYVKINKSYLDECGFVLIESVLNRGGLIIEKGGGLIILYTLQSQKKVWIIQDYCKWHSISVGIN